MSFIETLGSSAVTLFLFVEFCAAIGIALTLYKIHSLTRTVQSVQPSYNTWNTHNHYHCNEGGESEECEVQDQVDPEFEYEA